LFRPKVVRSDSCLREGNEGKAKSNDVGFRQERDPGGATCQHGVSVHAY